MERIDLSFLDGISSTRVLITSLKNEMFEMVCSDVCFEVDHLSLLIEIGYEFVE